jgi:diguanylate cyclase (GGDEF)-like protein
MDHSPSALIVAATGLALGALALVRASWRQHRFRGWPWWVAALATGSLALVLIAFGSGAVGPPSAAQLLLLAWPVLASIGMRRFHGRLGLPGHERVDWLVLALCALAVVAAGTSTAGSVPAVLMAGAASWLAHLYVAAVIGSSRSTEDAGALRVLAGVIAAVALLPSAFEWVVGAAPLADVLAVRGLASAFGLAVMTLIVLGLMSERTVRELRDSRRRLRVLANTDPLTGVPNRRNFHELAARLLSAPGESPPVLLLFDVDHFKLINDRLGHGAGDRALRLVGLCMQEALRAHDLAGRLGGDEFALLLDGTSLPQAMRVADRIVQQLQTQSADHRLPTLGMSFGLAQARAGEPIDDLLHRADRALYEAKRQGRSRAVAAHGSDMLPEFSESQRLGLLAM